jgi:16S rRNA processing protein RimM
MNSYRNIGKLVASFGLQGEIILLHSLGKRKSLKDLEVIFVEEKKGEMLPYFIESSIIKSDEELLIKLENIHTKEAAKKIVQREVWLTEEDFLKHAAKSTPIFWVGFQLVDAGNIIGEIKEVIEQPHQVLCRVDWNGKEALIPIHEQTLEKIDSRKKIIHVKLPEGLLDVYR